MDLYEHQGKDLFAAHGIPLAPSEVTETPEAARIDADGHELSHRRRPRLRPRCDGSEKLEPIVTVSRRGADDLSGEEHSRRDAREGLVVADLDLPEAPGVFRIHLRRHPPIADAQEEDPHEALGCSETKVCAVEGGPRAIVYRCAALLLEHRMARLSAIRVLTKER